MLNLGGASFSCVWVVGFLGVWGFGGFGGSYRFQNVREAFRFHFHLILSKSDLMVPSHGPQTENDND